MRMMTGLGLLAAVGLVAAGPAVATTTSSTFAVNLTLVAQCVINSTAALNFPQSGVLTGNVPASTTVAVQCTNTTPYNIGLNAGGTTGGTTTTRLLLNQAQGSTATVGYTLWQDNLYTQNWGNNVGVDTQGSTGTGASQSFTIYGRIPAQTTPAPGTYLDTITVTVTY